MTADEISSQIFFIHEHSEKLKSKRFVLVGVNVHTGVYRRLWNIVKFEGFRDNIMSDALLPLIVQYKSLRLTQRTLTSFPGSTFQRTSSFYNARCSISFISTSTYNTCTHTYPM